MRGAQTERLESVLRYSSAREIVKLRSSYRCVFAHWLPSMPSRRRLCVPAMLVLWAAWTGWASARARNILLPQTIYIPGWQISPACRLGLRRTA